MRRTILSFALCSIALWAGTSMGDIPDRGLTRSTWIDHTTWIDHDEQPIAEPPEWQSNYYTGIFRQSIVDPLSHAFDIPDKLLLIPRTLGAKTEHEAVNVNAFDEVPNSSWFTNRNHLKAIPPSELAKGPTDVVLPKKPWTIRHPKEGGQTAGFQIKDADGKKWLIKLDPAGYPQLVSGADMVSRTLFWAAGYNVPNNQPVRFKREDLKIDPELLKGNKDGEQMRESDLTAMLERGARFPDGSYSALASLFISGEAMGAPSMQKRRPGDTNDWYRHDYRRELRGMYVLASWLNSWDAKDQNFLDVFVPTTGDSLGHVDHYVLDVGASLGAAGLGEREPWHGYENTIDWGWMARRLVTLGFAVEPWRHAKGGPSIPAVGNFESAAYHPEQFKTLQEQPAFRAMKDRDAYWGAKIVASFSRDQVAAAIDAAGYDDPRAKAYLLKVLMERREKVLRYYFREVAPLDFFEVKDGKLAFHDLAKDVGITGAREYVVHIDSEGTGPDVDRELRIKSPEIPLDTVAPNATRLELHMSIAGSKAKPVKVELSRSAGSAWTVTWIRHA